MKRKFLFSFYETPQGKLLQDQETKFLARSISVSCKQTILQIGGVGWENEIVDCSLYKNYLIVDAKGRGYKGALNICAKSNRLPIQSESVDLVLIPHLLEFDENRFQTMREIERVLKPESDVIFLNFNSLNVWVRLQSLWDFKLSNSLSSHFISRSRLMDWLKLLDFEIKTTTEFTINSFHTTSDRFELNKRTFFSMSYAIRAVKRRYTLIPLTPVKTKPRVLIPAISGFKMIRKFFNALFGKITH